MRVLGVDPGLTRCGVGVVEGVAGRPLTMLGVGVVRTPADAAPCQSGVHAQYPHRAPPPQPLGPDRSRSLTRSAGVSEPLISTVSVGTDNAAGRRGVCPRRPAAYSRVDAGDRVPADHGRQASTFSMTSSETSKLAKTFCTSSLSSSASISLKIFRAPSSSSSTCMVGTKFVSAES